MGHTNAISFLQGRGADLHSKDKFDRTPIMWAAACAMMLAVVGETRGHDQVVDALIKVGADISTINDKQGHTALDMAENKGECGRGVYASLAFRRAQGVSVTLIINSLTSISSFKTGRGQSSFFCFSDKNKGIVRTAQKNGSKKVGVSAAGSSSKVGRYHDIAVASRTSLQRLS